MPAFPTISVGPVVRDPDEEHRASTPLELFVDLCFVVAVAQSAAALHHELVIGEVAYGVVGFLMAFFGAWWAWMNFTWFASAHDADDVPYRLLTLLQITGVLIYAAAVPRMVEDHDLTLSVIGYVIMRMALVTQWVRVARHFPDLRARCLRYAVGITLLQLLWVLILLATRALRTVAVPRPGDRRAARSRSGPRERRVAAATGGCSTPSTSRSATACSRSSCSASRSCRRPWASRRSPPAGCSLTSSSVAAGGLLIAFGAWWIYFDHPGHLTPNPQLAIRWGYVHVVVFVSLAAVGAGLHVAAEAVAGEASARTGALAVAIPVAGYLVGIVLLMVATRPRAEADLHRAQAGRRGGHPPRRSRRIGGGHDARRRRGDGRDGRDHDRRRARVQPPLADVRPIVGNDETLPTHCNGNMLL